jgi:oligopeptide transport system substrate-binding protein
MLGQNRKTSTPLARSRSRNGCADDHITYIKNPLWPGSEGYGQAKIDEIVVRFLDATVQMREYEAGNLDVVPIIPGAEYDRVSTDSTLSQELNVFAGMCTGVWGFHTQKPPFDNVHIRRAFNYAIDRRSLVNNVIKGGQIPHAGIHRLSVKLRAHAGKQP